jgi:hypothetical protein
MASVEQEQDWDVQPAQPAVQSLAQVAGVRTGLEEVATAMSFAMVSSLYSHAPDLATLEESIMTATYRRQA